MFRPPPPSKERSEGFRDGFETAKKSVSEGMVQLLVDQYGLDWAPRPGLPYSRSGPCREIYDLLQEHAYSWGGPCGGCRTCGKIDDGHLNDVGDNWTYEDHFVQLLVEKYGLKWKRQ